MSKIFKVGSLFAGVGGICLGFNQSKYKKAEYKLIWANENDPYACETYRNNFNHTLIEGDIKKVLRPQLVDEEICSVKKQIELLQGKEKDKLVKQLDEMLQNRDSQIEYYTKMNKLILKEPIDVLNGGFPCQAFSIAGEQKGFDDERGNLFLSIVELINQLGERHYKPRILLLENVKNLKSHDKGRTYKVIKTKLEETGYIVKDVILNTMDYTDLPQNRERIYIIGFLNKNDADKFNMFEKLDNYKKNKTADDRLTDVKDIVDYDLKDKKYYYTRDRYPRYFMTDEEFDNLLGKKSVKINLTEDISEMYQFYQVRRGMYVRKNKSNVCPTLTANMGTGGHNVPLIKTEHGIRKLTPAETFRLQGFPVPQSYKLPTKYKGKLYADGKLYKQAGNAVSVPIIKLLAEELLRILSE